MPWVPPSAAPSAAAAGAPEVLEAEKAVEAAAELAAPLQELMASEEGPVERMKGAVPPGDDTPKTACRGFCLAVYFFGGLGGRRKK